MYTVKVIVTVANPANPNERYKPATHSGIYITKGRRVTHAVIKKDVEAYFISRLLPKLGARGLTLSCKITVAKIKDDFLVAQK